MMRKTLLFCCTLAATANLSPAAIMVATTGTTLNMNFNGFGGDPVQVINGLTASLQLSGFTFTSITTGTHTGQTLVSFNYQLANTSGSPVTASRISNIGFVTTPDIVNTTDNAVTGTFTVIQYNPNFPNGIGVVDFCFTAQNCPGGGNGGVTIGQTGSGTASIYFAGSTTSLTFADVYVRYQSISCTVDCPGSATGDLLDSPVPEPSSFALIGLGLVGAATIARRRRRA